MYTVYIGALALSFISQDVRMPMGTLHRPVLMEEMLGSSAIFPMSLSVNSTQHNCMM